MQKLPVDKQLPFFKVIMENGNLKDLENWIYQEPSLLEVLGNDDYYELISLDFNQKFVLDSIQRIIFPYVDYTNYYFHHLKDILLSLQNQPNDMPLLAKVYELYCHGYEFLQSLAIDYGLVAKVELIENSRFSFSSESLNEVRIQSKLIYDALVDKKIVLLACPSFDKDIEYYQDFRSETEKSLTALKIG